MVNLSKTVREYTPVHIREECVPKITSPKQAAQECQSIEVANSGISYSELVTKSGRRHLESVFRSPTDSEIDKYRGIETIIEKTLKRDSLFRKISFASIVLCGLTIAATVSCSCLMQEYVSLVVTLGVFIASMFAFIPCIMITFMHNDGLVYKVLRNPSDLFISESGADTCDTHWAFSKAEQWIDRKIFRPCHCKDLGAFDKVINDRHNVFIVYSEAYNAAVIVDPNLFD